MEKVTRKKKLGGYPAVGVVISITLALLVIGIFGLILSYSQQLESIIRENITFKVYVKSALSETQLKQIEQNLAEKEFVGEGDKAIRFISREEAAEKLTHLGEYEEVLGDNPYKDMFEVRINPAFHDTVSLKSIKSELENLSGVIDAVYEKDFLETINSNFTKISMILIAITGVLLLTVILLINNTLRIALFSQRFLIRSMQLVGATRWFIQRPFILRAGAYGFLAGIIAGGLLLLLTRYAYQKIDMLIQLHNQDQFIILLGSIVLFGICIAIFSTYFSIRKYLSMSLDELY